MNTSRWTAERCVLMRTLLLMNRLTARSLLCGPLTHRLFTDSGNTHTQRARGSQTVVQLTRYVKTIFITILFFFLVKMTNFAYLLFLPFESFGRWRINKRQSHWLSLTYHRPSQSAWANAYKFDEYSWAQQPVSTPERQTLFSLHRLNRWKWFTF